MPKAPIDWFPVLNTTSDVIPPGALIVTTDDVDDNGNVNGTQPNANGQLCAVNSLAAIPPGMVGQATYDNRVIVSYDATGSGPPNPGDIWGSTPGSWLASYNPGGEAGFQIIGAANGGLVNAVRISAQQTTPDCVTGPIPEDAFINGVSTVSAPVANTVYSLVGTGGSIWPLSFAEDGTYLLTCSVCVELAAGSYPGEGATPIYVWMQAFNAVFPFFSSGSEGASIPGTCVSFSPTEFGVTGTFNGTIRCKTMTGLVTACPETLHTTVTVQWYIPNDSSGWSGTDVQVQTSGSEVGNAGTVTLLSQYCNCNQSAGSPIFPSGSASPPPPSGGSGSISFSGTSGGGFSGGGSGSGSSGGSSGGSGGSGSTGSCCTPAPSYLFGYYSNKSGPCTAPFIPFYAPITGSQTWTATDVPITIQCVNGLWGISDSRYGPDYTVTQITFNCGPPFLVVLNVTYTGGPCAGSSYTLTLQTN